MFLYFWILDFLCKLVFLSSPSKNHWPWPEPQSGFFYLAMMRYKSSLSCFYSLGSLSLRAKTIFFHGRPVHVTIVIVFCKATSKAFEKRASFAIVLTILRAKAALSDLSFGLALRSLGSCCPFFCAMAALSDFSFVLASRSLGPFFPLSARRLP